MTHKIIDDIKAAVEAAEQIAERAAAAITTLVNGAQDALDANDNDELQAILASAKQTADELGAAVASVPGSGADTASAPEG